MFGIFAGKEGPVHDVQWSYSGSEFAVVYGCILIFLPYNTAILRTETSTKSFPRLKASLILSG